MLVSLCGLAVFIWALRLNHIEHNYKHYKQLEHYLAGLNKAIFVRDKNGHISFANGHYKKICFGAGEGDIFALLGRERHFAEDLYLLEQAAQKGQALCKEIPLPANSCLGQLFPSPKAEKTSFERRLAISTTPSAQANGDTIWQIEEVSAYHIDCQNHIAQLEQIIALLDGPLAAIFTLNEQDEIISYNKSFASWLALSNKREVQDFLAQGWRAKLDFKQLLTKESQKNWSLWQKERKSELDDLSPDQDQPAFGALPISLDLDLPAANGEGGGITIECYCQRSFEQNILYCVAIGKIKRASQSILTEQTAPFSLELICDNSPEPLALLEGPGKIIHANAKFGYLLGYSSKEGGPLKDLLLDNLVSGYEDSKISEHLAIALGQYQELPAFEAQLKADRRKYLSFSFAKLPKGDKSYYLCFAKEVTGQKALQDKLEQNQKLQAIGQLAGGIAHDFNNVLTSIIMSCDLLLDSHRISDPSHPDLINIKNNANRAAALVQQLLAFSRRQLLSTEKVDLRHLLSDLYLMIKRLIGPKIELRFQHDPQLWPVNIDPALMQRIIINLVINARDAMENGGSLRIEMVNFSSQGHSDAGQMAQIGQESANPAPMARAAALTPDEGDKAPRYVALSICDSGIGIAPEHKDKIYEPFFTTKAVGKGTGLGLSMVYGAIQQMGGKIVCHSKLGQGTCFRMLLPVFEEPQSHVSAANGAKRAPSQEGADKLSENKAKALDLTGNATILLVEDEHGVRLANNKALSSRGYKVLQADCGQSALEIVKQQGQEIDLIISDVVMPEMDGPSLLREVRALYPSMAFIFVSGYAKEAFASNLPSDASFEFLNKPFTLKSLISKVKEVLGEKTS